MRKPTLREIENKQNLYEYVTKVADEIERAHKKADELEKRPTIIPDSEIQRIRRELSAGGGHEIDLTGLGGYTRTAQAPTVKVVSSLPDAGDLTSGTMIILSGAPNKLYVRAEGNPPKWILIG